MDRRVRRLVGGACIGLETAVTMGVCDALRFPISRLRLRVERFWRGADALVCVTSWLNCVSRMAPLAEQSG